MRLTHFLALGFLLESSMTAACTSSNSPGKADDRAVGGRAETGGGGAIGTSGNVARTGGTSTRGGGEGGGAGERLADAPLGGTPVQAGGNASSSAAGAATTSAGGAFAREAGSSSEGGPEAVTGCTGSLAEVGAMQDACPATYEAAYHVAQRCPRTGRCNSVGGSFRNCGAGKTVVIDSCMSFKGCVYSQDGAELIGAFLESEGAFYCDASAHGIKAGSIPAGCFRGWDYPFEGFEDIACSQEAGTWPISKDPCTPSNHSDLAGVRIEFDPQPCAFTLAEAQAGISFSYRVIVDNDLPSVNVKTPNGNACFSVDASGLPTKATVTGAGQRYAIDDAGRCAAQSAVAVDLHKGTYTDVFVWTGRNWSGPSDTNNPLGPAFPAGDYTVDVTVNGADFVVWSRLTITLVP